MVGGKSPELNTKKEIRMDLYDQEKAREAFRTEYFSSAVALSKWIVQAPSYVDRALLIENLLEDYTFDWLPDLPMDTDSIRMWCYEELQDMLEDYSSIQKQL